MSLPKDALEATKMALQSWGLKVEENQVLLPSGEPLRTRWRALGEIVDDLSMFHGVDGSVEIASAILHHALSELYSKKKEAA